MKPIIKKYASKDLNIAYNDGMDTERERLLAILEVCSIKPSLLYDDRQLNDFLDKRGDNELWIVDMTKVKKKIKEGRKQ